MHAIRLLALGNVLRCSERVCEVALVLLITMGSQKLMRCHVALIPSSNVSIRIQHFEENDHVQLQGYISYVSYDLRRPTFAISSIKGLISCKPISRLFLH